LDWLNRDRSFHFGYDGVLSHTSQENPKTLGQTVLDISWQSKWEKKLFQRSLYLTEPSEKLQVECQQMLQSSTLLQLSWLSLK
jgi:hypothetical protein